MPYVLTTRNPVVKTIADFGPNDRIAVPTVKISGQALALQMAAAKVWGQDKYDKLDEITVTMGHPDAMQSVLSGQSVNSHFAVAPFNYYELKVPGIRAVLKSYDAVGGKHTNGTLVMTKKFFDANPKLTQVVLASFNEANDFIKADPRRSAQIYLAKTGDKTTVGELEKMVVDPDVAYTTTPINVMAFVEFMHRVGRIKKKPASWKDLFFPPAHALAGS